MTVEHINDAFREADKLLEDWNNRITFDNLSLVERYIKGELVLFCEFIRTSPSSGRGKCRADPMKYRAIFQGVFVSGVDSNTGAKGANIDDSFLVCGPYRSEESVLVGVTKFMELPKRIIPSLIWFQSLKETDGFGVDALYFSQHAGFKTVRIPRYRKSVVTSNHAAIQCNQVTDKIIEGGPQVVNNVADYRPPAWGWVLGDLEPVDIASAIRFVLDDNGIRVGIKEGADLRFQLTDVLFGPFDF